MASQGGEIREGFLCPMCMKDLGTVSQLQSHFEEAHSTEDKVVLNQLRGLFDRAKKKFLGDKDEDQGSEGFRGASSATSTTPTYSLYDVDYWQEQEFGQTRQLTDHFRSVRDARVDKYVVETNKLLIRLDKLVNSSVPQDSSKRKAFEKSVVMWVPDNEVKKCRFCERSFSLTRRRHHCRLCGRIMCDRCSQFLTYAYARKLTDPAFSFDKREEGFLKRSGSNSSLNSMFSMEGDPHIRSCNDCRKLLERRDQLMEQRNNKSTIVLMYEKMKACIRECESLLDTYNPMLESLSAGESQHNLRDAQRLRGELIRQYETIDKISKRIASLGYDSEEGPSAKQALLRNKRIASLGYDSEEGPTAKQALLQKSVRLYASNFMQENVVGLQNLPSEEQYAKLQSKRTAEIQKQIAMERQQTLQAQEAEQKKLEKQASQQASEEKKDRAGSHKKTNSVGSSKGWKPAENVIKPSTSDPMLQQIEIIKGYIKQAKDAKKWDEVNMLEQNLQDLQIAYSSQQKEIWS